MSRPPKLVFATADAGLLAHWQSAFGNKPAKVLTHFADFQPLNLAPTSTVWVDFALPGMPAGGSWDWAGLFKDKGGRFVATSSNPQEAQAIQLLDAGFAGYCHAYSDAATLRQVKQVVEAGHVWIGKTLMQRLVQSARLVPAPAPKIDASWAAELTEREKEVAVLAANGASNIQIANNCNISERTVKAHLSAVFVKLNLTDRLQLALRVHGIT